MTDQPTYEAAVYERTVHYINLKGVTSKATLYFALDPITLMQVMTTVKPAKSRSANPALKNQPGELTDEQQIKLILDLAAKAAGFPSDDGETWEPFYDFHENIAAKAFMTKLTSSDADRKEFSEKVILAPFKAFVDYASADPDNSPADVQQFKTMLAQMENVFKTEPKKAETLEEKKARLAAELESLGDEPGEQ